MRQPQQETLEQLQELDRVNGVLLEELAEEAQNLIDLHQKWLKASKDIDVRTSQPENSKDVEDYYNLDGELYASIVHLKVHAGTLQESLDDMTDLELASS